MSSLPGEKRRHFTEAQIRAMPHDLRYMECGVVKILDRAESERDWGLSGMLRPYGFRIENDRPLTPAQAAQRVRIVANFERNQGELREAARKMRAEAAVRRASDPDLAGINKYLAEPALRVSAESPTGSVAA